MRIIVACFPLRINMLALVVEQPRNRFAFHAVGGSIKASLVSYSYRVRIRLANHYGAHWERLNSK
jgi:hypothetical protein